MWQLVQRLSLAPLLFVLGLSSCTVFLVSGKVRSVQITPANPTIPVGGQQQFIANVLFSDGVILQAGRTAVIWSSSNPAVANISSSGLTTGRSPGTTRITGTFDRVSGSTTLTVTALSQVKVQAAGSASKLELTFPQNAQQFLYVANPLDNTISIYRMGTATDGEQPIASVSVEPARGPSWMAVHPSGRFLYAAEHGSGEISAFSIDPTTGGLTVVPGSPFSTEGRPWSISVDPAGEFLMVTHFESLHVSRFRIDWATGALTPEGGPFETCWDKRESFGTGSF